MEEKKKGKRGRPAKNVQYVPSLINFKDLVKLNDLNIDPDMLKSMKSELGFDKFISHKGGVPCATNIMVIGDPGVGKTTVLLDLLAAIQKNTGRKCLFISGEMGRKQMYAYNARFEQFGQVKTLFMADYLNNNAKDVIEQVLAMGWDLVLIDSLAEILDAVRDDNNWDRRTAEAWMIDVCIKMNKGENKAKNYTSFLLIQQVTKGGEFCGSNKLKHITDATLEMRQEGKKNGSKTYMEFTKNRNGSTGQRVDYAISVNSIEYGDAYNPNDEDEKEE